MNVAGMELLLPAGVAAVLAWIASILVHLVLKYHNSDYNQLENELDVASALGATKPAPNIYNLPFCTDMKALEDDGMKRRFEDGPVALITVLPNGLPPMGKLIGLQVAYFLIGALLIGYCVSLALAPGAPYMQVFRVTSAVAFLAYGWAVIPFAIWYGHPWSVTAKYLLDALIYGLVTAGAYAWLWPAPA